MQVSEFKESAWQTRDRAEAYHVSTREAPPLFRLIRHDLYLRYIQRYAVAGAKILDLGCGSGLLSLPLHDLGYRVVACDVSQSMLARLSVDLGSRNIELRLGSGFNIPAEDGEFDMVVSRMFIPHFPDWRVILQEKARVTRKDGIVLFDFGNREHLASWDAGDAFPYGTDMRKPETFYAVASREEMHDAAALCGLDVVAVIPHGLLLHNVHFWKAVGHQGVADFNTALNELLKDSKAREMLMLIEEQFVAHLPNQVTYGNITILRRTATDAPHR